MFAEGVCRLQGMFLPYCVTLSKINTFFKKTLTFFKALTS